MQTTKTVADMDHIICLSLLGIVMLLLWVGSQVSLG